MKTLQRTQYKTKKHDVNFVAIFSPGLTEASANGRADRSVVIIITRITIITPIRESKNANEVA